MCSTRPYWRDIAAFDKIDALLSPGPTVLKSAPLGRPRPCHPAPRRVCGASAKFPLQRRLIQPVPGIILTLSGFLAQTDSTLAGGPTLCSGGSPCTPSGLPLPAARPVSPPRLTNPGSSAKLHSPSKKSKRGPDCTPPLLGLSFLRCSQKQIREKNHTKKIRNNSTHPRNRAGLFCVKHI